MSKAKIYRCIKAFSVPRVDEDGFADEGKSFHIKKGSKWEETEGNICNAEISLIHSKGISWLGISKNALDEYFEEMINNDK